ncbi:MAG TPA: hypothetical protein VFN11_03225 [Ktedonobacterales bacterium]|nr:hypothetical protein [Ktedonobacterales bacterium]
MPTILNFDTLTYDTVEISKRDQKWTLRDDVPTKVIMRCFAFAALSERLQQATHDAEVAHPDDYTAATQALEAAYAAEERSAANIVGDIFRHTDPNVSDEALLAVFSLEDLQGIANLFFTLHSQRSNPQRGTISAPSTVTAAESPKKNRTQRRATVGAKRN